MVVTTKRASLDCILINSLFKGSQGQFGIS